MLGGHGHLKVTQHRNQLKRNAGEAVGNDNDRPTAKDRLEQLKTAMRKAMRKAKNAFRK